MPGLNREPVDHLILARRVRTRRESASAGSASEPRARSGRAGPPPRPPILTGQPAAQRPDDTSSKNALRQGPSGLASWTAGDSRRGS